MTACLLVGAQPVVPGFSLWKSCVHGIQLTHYVTAISNTSATRMRLS